MNDDIALHIDNRIVVAEASQVAHSYNTTPGDTMDLKTGRDWINMDGQAEGLGEERDTSANTHSRQPSLHGTYNKAEHGCKLLPEVVRHMEFCTKVYRQQIKEGLQLLHEPPLGPRPWGLSSMQLVLQDRRAIQADVGLCMFGMMPTAIDGSKSLAKKPT